MTTDLVARLSLVDWPDGEAAPTLTTLRPSGFPDRAVLFVKSVSVVAATEAVPAAVVEEVARTRVTAVRPVVGRLPPDADAVWFADETEVVAAFVRALVDGTAARQWWWQLLPAGRITDPIGAVVASEHPAAVIDALVGWGAFGELVGVGRAEELLDVVRSIAASHDLTVEIGHSAPTDGSERRGPQEPHANTASVTTVSVLRGGSVVTRGVATSRESVGQVVSELAAAAVGRRPAPSTSGTGPLPVMQVPHSAPIVPSVPSHRSADGRLPPETVAGAAEFARPSSPSPAADATRPAVHGDPGASGPANVRPEPPVRPVEPADPIRPMADAPLRRPDPSPDAPSGVRSACAGALFVVNPIQRSVLPAELDDVPRWAVVEAVARDLLLGADPTLVDDAIWSVLADLAGRPADRPVDPAIGTAVAPVVTWILDAADLDRSTLAGLLAVPGIVEHDATHVDVYFGLGRADVITRRLGLDLDPGWVPALGRVVRFHYRDDLP